MVCLLEATRRPAFLSHSALCAWLVLGLVALATAAPGLAASNEVLEGWLHIDWGDAPQGSDLPSHQTYLLGLDDGGTVALALSGALREAHGGFATWNGRRVRAWIAPATEDGAAQGVARRVAALRLLGGGSLGTVTGSQPWVSILCKFSDVAATPRSLSFFQDMYANTPGGLDHYWREVSYGAIDVVGSTAVDWVTLPQPQGFYIPTPGSGSNSDRSALFNDCTAAADPFIDYSNGGSPFAGINMMFNDVLDCCAWGGSRFATLDGVSKTWRVTWEPPWGYADEAVIAHEMGHGFGLPHSNNSDGDSSPYDSPWDVMSAATGYAVSDPVYGRLGKHTISYHKDLLGWIPPSQQFEATTEGNFAITLDHLAAATTSNYRMARIPIDASRYYTVEVRTQSGNYDGNVPGNAVIIHTVDPARGEPAWVVDGDDPAANYADTEGVMWRTGETFFDVDNGISITVGSATANGFAVTLSTGADALIFADGFESGDTSAWN